MNTPLQPQWEKKSRFLTQLLIWSGAINIGLLSSLIYLVFEKRPETIAFEQQPVSSILSYKSQSTNQGILTTFSTLSWAELVAHLDSLELVEEGYKKRDLAVASLVAFHGFDIERALQGTFLQRRTVAFARTEGPEEIILTFYPGLTEDQFLAIRHFIQTEKFPFTSQGLFYEIQHTTAPRDSQLLQAFYLTAEFNSVLTLCQRTGIHLPHEFLIEMVAQGDWKTLHQFAEDQKLALDLSPGRLKTLLLSYVRCRSIFAAKILLQWDREFLLKRLEDRDLIAFLDLFKDSSPPLESFLKDLLISSRSDAVLQKAAERLYLFAQIPFPEPYDHKQALAAFAGIPLQTASQPIQQALAPAAARQGEIKYVIQRGDNLWKIARKHKVSIEAIRKANRLETDKLREGKTLIIPAKANAD